MKKTLASLLVAGMMFFNGCISGYVTGPLASNRRVTPELSMNIGLEARDYNKIDLGKKCQTMEQPHPNDAGFLSGSTTAQLHSGSDSAIKAGIGFGVKFDLTGNETEERQYWDNWSYAKEKSTPPSPWKNLYLRLGIGIDERMNLEALNRNGLNCISMETEQQSSDTRYPGSGSFVFSKLDSGHWTTIPYLDAEIGAGKFSAGVSCGKALTSYRISAGHYRWGAYEVWKQESKNVEGDFIKARIGYRIISRESYNDPNMSINLFTAQEKYDVDFSGEPGKIKNQMFGLEFRNDF